MLDHHCSPSFFRDSPTRTSTVDVFVVTSDAISRVARPDHDRHHADAEERRQETQAERPGDGDRGPLRPGLGQVVGTGADPWWPAPRRRRPARHRTGRCAGHPWPVRRCSGSASAGAHACTGSAPSASSSAVWRSASAARPGTSAAMACTAIGTGSPPRRQAASRSQLLASSSGSAAAALRRAGAVRQQPTGTGEHRQTDG